MAHSSVIYSSHLCRLVTHYGHLPQQCTLAFPAQELPLQGLHSKPQQGENKSCVPINSTGVNKAGRAWVSKSDNLLQTQSHPTKTLVGGPCQQSYLQTEAAEQQTEVPPRQIKAELWSNQRHL